ncbi:30S ribosomal protein S20 [Bacteriovorax stolpii]|uniref:Small ribosomal subunit protein bS20 n=1 Tax=Bacteriovorax stolpii TaxID=960 RepID=A0A2K9NUZ9_BACTC|nr:30S ribosomal protein S20 [Bacteriovorax stolpii]AUN99328.1 30S ribosomal protein S20 [Bacteriovorax stolpii]QDK40692.1 30S ribosomal protein S20 [Bacteriovorax stolpii]TDP55132.1 SSU ribosomal protein S20P [Bacteriovorax stolpii]BDT29499.1 30S ribosomal protein S20 [Bacteriovorax sp. HI3]
MANHKSSEKRAKQDIKKNLANKVNESKTKTAVKKVRDAITAGDKKAAAAVLKTAQAELRKLAKTGVIKANTAARKTSRLASQINNLK